MIIAFTSSGANWTSLIDPRFGRTEFIVIYDEEKQVIRAIDNSKVKNVAHGAGSATAQTVFELNPGVLITGNGPGETASNALKHHHMRIFVDAHDMTLKQAYEQYKNGKLREV
jgi:predicted Fe-Mo cluster-binding NifX family protein